MSKYDPLWHYVADHDIDSATLSFEHIEHILGFPVDHSLLTYKKELIAYGYQVGKISMKQQTINFVKIGE